MSDIILEKIKIWELHDDPTIPLQLYDERVSDLRNIDIPYIPEGVRIFSCNALSLEKLPLLPNSLRQLHCVDCDLKELPELPTNLQVLNCDSNFNLRHLPTLPTSLKVLSCNYTRVQLEGLPENLEYLSFYETHADCMPLLPRSLKILLCGYNNISCIDSLPENLEYLDCMSNNIRELPTLPSSLKELVCVFNDIAHAQLPLTIPYICANSIQMDPPSIPYFRVWLDAALKTYS